MEDAGATDDGRKLGECFTPLRLFATRTARGSYAPAVLFRISILACTRTLCK